MNIDGSAYSSLIGFRGWSDSSGGNAHELAFTGNGNLYHRQGSTTTWSSWNRIPMCGTDNTFSGTNTFSGQVVLSRTTDADGTTDAKPALRIGAISGTHLELDGNEIMAKSDATHTGPLYLNNNGGQVNIGAGGLKVSGTIEGTLSGNASTASQLTNITSTDVASNSATQRYVFISYNDLTTNRPAYDTRFTFQTSTGILTAPIFAGSGANLTSLNASKISSGTLSSSRLPTVPVTKGGTGRTTYTTTNYTGNQYRASKIQNTIPTSIDNGCIVYVYSDTTTL